MPSSVAWQAGNSSQIRIFDNMFYTYVLRSHADKMLYIGYSSQLRKRLNEHRNGLVSATKNRLPVQLIYYEACLNKDNAIKREKYLKTGFGRKFLSARIKEGP